VSGQVRRAYAERSSEYSDLFGSMEHVHPADLQLVSSWADEVTGPVVDAGCGPGQWTDSLVRRGVDARGVDQVPEFVARARAAYPAVRFGLGTIERLDAAPAELGGVLAWYSLIHHEPDEVGLLLREFARVIRPGGRLLIGLFTWPRRERFDHAVVPAYRWPIAEFAREVEATGFEVFETRERTAVGARPQGAVVARRRAAP
jgi:SAM-dependent methyltransferase